MNTNALHSIYCPKCGQEDHFDIVVTATCMVSDEGTDSPVDPEWDNNSYATCIRCKFHSKLFSFYVPAFNVTFDTTTEQSAEDGESARLGWIDEHGYMIEDPFDRPEVPAYQFDPEDYDPDVYASLEDAIVDWAVNLLKLEGATHPNTSDLHNIEWWSTEGNEVVSWETSETIRKSFHPINISDEALVRIIKEIHQ